MRRSARIRWEIPVLVVSLDPGVPFNENCETVAVNAHGCGLISPTPLAKGTPVRLAQLPDNREAMARVADVVKLGEDGRTWLLGLQLDKPENVWGVRTPPHDWEKAIMAAGENQREATVAAPPLVAAAAAGAAGYATAVATSTVATAPEFAITPAV